MKYKINVMKECILVFLMFSKADWSGPYQILDARQIDQVSLICFSLY